MNIPIILHGTNPEETFALGKAVSERLGISLIRLGKNCEKEFDRDFSGKHGCVWCVPSSLVIDRVRRIRCISEGIVVRIGKSEGWSVRENHDELADDASNRRVNELIESEVNEAHLVVVPKTVGFEKSVEEIVSVVKRRPVAVAALDQSYLVEVGRGITERAVLERNFGAATALYITDENVKRIHGEKLKGFVDRTGMRINEVVLEPGEESKCLKTLGSLFEKALEGGIDRSSWVIAAGGGVVTDIGGLVAAMWMRGIKWVGIPTTLLSMVDASVGGKTAIDFGFGKNAVGAFWQPSSVVCDVEWLLTETERNYVGALSEVVKTAMIGDAELFRLLEEQAERIVARDLDLMAEVVRRCVQVKARVVGIDPRESGIRALLNLGHTVGHALEALGEYKKYTHGEAVSIGLVAALRLGRRTGQTASEVEARTIRLLRKLGLPIDLPKEELEKASELLGHDKKRHGSSIRFVYVHDIGDVRAERVVLEDLREAVIGLAAQ
jgi:shikimate kinase/3-dehydroquinate synthase